MKNPIIYVLVFVCYLVAGCNGDDKKMPMLDPSRYDGQYEVTFQKLEGECEVPEPLDVIMWEGSMYSLPAEGFNLIIHSELNGQYIEGSAYAADDMTMDFYGTFDKQGATGNWKLREMDCHGFFMAVKGDIQ